MLSTPNDAGAARRDGAPGPAAGTPAPSGPLRPGPCAAVTTTASGQPLRVEVEGRRYRVAAAPVRWYERRAWWEEVARAPRGQCPHLVDREVWQVQVTLERPGAARRRRPLAEAELMTLELERHRNTGSWSVVSL